MNNEIIGYKETVKQDFSRLRRIHHNMMTRCYNKNSPQFKHYGGKGVIVCDEWKNNVTSFIFWAIDNGYRDNLTIDRIDYNGIYSPENCRWADMITQNNNTSRNRNIEHNGLTMSISNWARLSGISRPALNGRIKTGWSFDEAINAKL